MLKKKRKVGRPSKKDLQRERNLEIASVLSVVLVFAIALFGLKNYISNNLNASVTQQKATQKAAQKAQQQLKQQQTREAAQKAQQQAIEAEKRANEEKVKREQKEASRIDISKALVTQMHTQYYIGKPIRPRPTLAVQVNGKTTTLKNDTDVTIKYKNNINIGTATIIYTGQGNYKGEKKVIFNIVENKLSNKNEITIKNVQRSLNSGKCNSKPIKFSVTAPSGVAINKIEYITPSHGWKNLETYKYSCTGDKNTCTITNADRASYEFYRVTASNGTVQQFGPYNVCTTPMIIRDATKLKDISAASKSGKCQNEVTFTVQDTLKTKVTRVQYSDDNGKTWNTFTKIARSSDRTKETVKITESHKNMLIKAKNFDGVEQVFGRYNIKICSKK